MVSLMEQFTGFQSELSSQSNEFAGFRSQINTDLESFYKQTAQKFSTVGMNDNDKKLLQQTVNDLNQNISNNRNAIQLLV